ncbi:MAG: hypothetical protein GY851_07585 [bacterium]|nr:hypothetical protein [bacterium]
MPLSINLEAHGLKPIMDAIKDLQKAFGKSKVGGVDLVGKAREAYPKQTGTTTNKKILEHLAEGNSRSSSPKRRDFATLTDENMGEVSTAFVGTLNAGLDSMVSRMNQQTRKAAATMAKSGLLKGVNAARAARQKQIDNLVAKSFISAMRKYQEIVRDRLNTGTGADGSRHPVTESHAKWRAKELNMPDDTNIIGRASGQLLDAITNPSLIRPRRRK